MDFATLIILLIAIIPLIIYTYYKKKYNYWAKRGVPYITPKFFYGNGEQIIKGQISYGDQFLDFYRQFKTKGVKHGGVYILSNPVYVAIHPEIIRCILQKDFDHFMDRGMYVNEESDPLSGHLFNLAGAKWKNLRVKLTPTFTSGKMKMMFKILLKCCDGLDEMVEEYAKDQVPVEVRETVARFTTDIIVSCAFGIECNSMKNPDSEFRKYGRRIFEAANSSQLKQLVASLFPLSLIKKLGISFTDKEVENFFIKAVKDTMDYRERNNVSRNDFLHLLIQLKETGSIEDDSRDKSEENSTRNGPHLTLNEIAAQCFVFFAAGFETSSTTTTFALYELSVNVDIQEKLRVEILSVLEKYGNTITYESIFEMTYLEKVMNETMRKYPPVPVLFRVCDKNYRVPTTDAIIEKRTSVQVPVLGLHYDPEYFPNPEIFDPERFSEENKSRRPAFTFLPFGEGPRNCIGLRFGKLQTKLALITILRHYRVTLNEKTKTPLQMEKRAFILGVEGGVWLEFSKI